MTKKGISTLLVFLIFSYIFSALSYKFTPSSDSMSGILEAADIAKGNFALKGWYLSTVTFYFTDLVWFALAIKLFGYSEWITYVIPGLMAGGLIASCYALGTSSGYKKAWPLLLFLFFPGTAVSYMLSVAIIHVPTYAYILLSYILIEFYCKRQNKLYLLLASIIASLTIFSDDITTYLFFLPVAIGCFISNANTKDKSVVFLFLVFSYILFKVILYFTNSPEFFYLPGVGSPTFVSYDKLSFNISLLFKGLLILFNADFFGKVISSPDGVFSSLKFASLVMFFVLLIPSLIKIRKLGLVDAALLIASLIMIPAYALSDKPVDAGTTRYLIPVIIFGSIFLCRNINITKKSNIILWVFAILISAYSLTYINQPDFSFSRDRSTSKYRLISDFLTKHNLTNGYATFWNAAATSVEKEFSIGPINIDVANKKVTPSFWLTKTSYFNNGNNFFIVDNEQQRQVIEELYGKPELTYMVWNSPIMVYSHPVNIDEGDVQGRADTVKSDFKAGDKNQICNAGAKGMLAYGPYKTLGRGWYSLKINAHGDQYEASIFSYVTGVKIKMSQEKYKNGSYVFEIKKDMPSAEIQLFVQKGSDVCFESYSLQRVK